MKKFIGLIVFAMMIVLPMRANAAVALEYSCGDDVELAQPDGKYKYSKTCNIAVNVTGNNTLEMYGITASYDTSIIKVQDVQTNNSWSLTTNSATSTGAAITWKPSSAISNTKSEVATIVFYIDKSDNTKNCDINFTQCFNKDGQFICDNPKTPTCRVENGKYYGKNGTEVTEEVYNNECLSNPQTGNFVPYIVIITGAILAVSVFTISRKNNKLYKI